MIDIDRRQIGDATPLDYRTLNRSSGYSRTVPRGYDYRFAVSTCTSSFRTACGPWSSTSSWLRVPRLPNPPTGLSLSRSGDNVEVTYEQSTWSDGTGRYYEFELRQSETESGTYEEEYTKDDSTSPVRFRDVDRDHWYQAFGRRCTDSGRKDCGDWSTGSNNEEVPELPGKPDKPSLSVSEDDLTVTYEVDDDIDSHDDYTFTTSDTEDGTYTTYTGGTLSGAKLSSVATGKWYKARVRRCLDSKHTECSDWSGYSDAVEVPEPSRFPTLSLTIQSGADGKSVIASFTLTANYDYTLELRSKTSESDSFSRVNFTRPAATGTSHSFTGLTDTSGQQYQARLRACITGSTTDCDDWVYTVGVLTLSKAPAPTVTGITVSNEDDLTIAYTVPTWSDGTATVYDFKIRRGESSSSAFTLDYTDATTPSGQPHKFNDVHTGYYYKALSRRCSDTAKSICGNWSGVQSGVAVPALSVPPPTNIRVSAVSHVEISATFSNSSWSGQTAHHYVFELGKSSTETGTYVYGVSPTTQSSSKVSFSGVETGKWYKVRGKRCHSSVLKRCGAWEESSSGVQTVAPNPMIEVTDPQAQFTIKAGLTRAVVASATGLDATRLHKIRFETLADFDASTDLLRFVRCDSTGMDQPLETAVPVGSMSTGKLSIELYGCHDGETSLIGNLKLRVSVIQDDAVVAKDDITVQIEPVPVPTDLRADGNNRDVTSARFAITWVDETDASSWEMRFGEECPVRSQLCSPLATTWNTYFTGITTRPYTHLSSSSYPFDLNKLYRIKVRSNRNGATSSWSEPAFVFPAKSPPEDPVALTGYYGHQANGDYHFRLCDNTFPEESIGYHTRWVDDILGGFASWGEFVNWSGDTHHQERKIVSTTRDTSLTVEGRDSCEPLTLTKIHLDLRAATVGDGISDYPDPEVRFVSRWVLIDRCLAYDASFIACAPHGNRISTAPTFVSSPTRTIADNVDILFDEGYLWDANKTKHDAGCSNLFRTAAHEVGHAFGVWSHHSTASVSIMSARLSGLHCEPQLYDVVGMLTNYQSRK